MIDTINFKDTGFDAAAAGVSASASQCQCTSLVSVQVSASADDVGGDVDPREHKTLLAVLLFLLCMHRPLLAADWVDLCIFDSRTQHNQR